jgi:hypothetical protein
MNIQELKPKLIRSLSVAGKVAIIIAALSIGFAFGQVYRSYQDRAQSKVQEIHTPTTTSVAINERGEMLIIDRSSGKYELYTDSIGDMIFNLYANKLYSTAAEQ